MQQVSLYIKGERNYYNIEGDTGPLVYPALHVYIYRLLYALTDHGKSIFSAQIIFAILYLGTLGVVIACYRRAKVRLSTKLFVASLIIISGSTVSFSLVNSFKTSAQHLHATTLQRLLDCPLLVALHLLLPTALLDDRHSALLLWARREDELVACASGDRLHPSPSHWSRAVNYAGACHCADTGMYLTHETCIRSIGIKLIRYVGSFRVRVCPHTLASLHFSCLSVEPPIPLPMDSELALRSSRDLSLVHLFIQPARSSRTTSTALCINTLDGSFTTIATRHAQIIPRIRRRLARNRRNR